MAGMRLLALVVCAGVATVQAGSPVTKVVELLKELKAKIEQDGTAEQKTYNKFACWCETTSARKAESIHQAVHDIRSYGNKVLELKGKVSSRTSEIARLSRDLNENQRAQDTATALREKQNRGYNSQKETMEETLNALERGITTLSGKKVQKSFVQDADDDSHEQAADLSAADQVLLDEHTEQTVTWKESELAVEVHRAVDSLPNGHKMSGKDLDMLRSFTKNPAGFLEQSSRNPQSATIQGILKDMYDTFAVNLEQTTKEEATNQKNFESIMSVKQEEYNTVSSQLAKKESQKSEHETDLASMSQSLDDTQKQMKDDTALFDNLKSNCHSKATEWSERVRARTEELHGIAKALEILSSDDSRALFDKSSVGTFLQISAKPKQQTPQEKAADLLKVSAKKASSLRLAALAATLRSGGSFDAVVGQVDKMIAVLKAEGKEDAEQRDWCKEETFKNQQEAARFQYKVEQHESKLSVLNVKMEELDDTKQKATDEVADTRRNIQDLEDTRTSDHQGYEQRKADDEQAVSLLSKAEESLSAYYKDNKASLLQKKHHKKHHSWHDKPEFKVSEDDAPEAELSDSGKSSSEAGGIISLMKMIRENLESEIKHSSGEEVESQKAFETEVAEAHQVVEQLVRKITNLEASLTSTQSEIDDAEQAKENLEGLLQEEQHYLMGIKPDCDWILKSFDSRREKRDAEQSGLIDAKGLLQGAAASTGEPTSPLERESLSFLQKK